MEESLQKCPKAAENSTIFLSFPLVFFFAGVKWVWLTGLVARINHPLHA